MDVKKAGLKSAADMLIGGYRHQSEAEENKIREAMTAIWAKIPCMGVNLRQIPENVKCN
jgi:hypothetical protein